MDRYQKVEKAKVETPIDENEIRITSKGKTRSYITYALTLLQEKNSDEIVLKAMGRAINKTVTIVELIKRRIVGLHQITMIQSTDITDTWEPLEEGLQTLETTRKVSMVTITLSKQELDKTNIGYQPPIPADQVKVSEELDYDGEGSPPAHVRGRTGRGRGRSRGGPSGNGFPSGEYEDGGRGRGRPRGDQSGNDFPYGEYEDGGYERDRGYNNRGRGRGGGRNYFGRGRGGYNGPPMNADYDAEGYNQEFPRGNGFPSGEYEDGGYERDRGYNNRGSGRGRNYYGRGRGGYNGPPMETDYDAEGYNQDVPRGRGRGRVPRGSRGRGFRYSEPVEAVAE